MAQASQLRIAIGLLMLALIAIMLLFRFASESSDHASDNAPETAGPEEVLAAMESSPSSQQGSTSPREVVEVRLTIKGVSSDEGELRIAVFDDAAGFPDHQNALHRRSVTATAGEQTVTLDLPHQGQFAIAVYHDVDANERLNRAALGGYPIEPYGFSQDARATFGPPEYDAAAVFIQQSGDSLSLTLR